MTMLNVRLQNITLKVRSLKLDTIDNNNISSLHTGEKGLHRNGRGREGTGGGGGVAMNMIPYIQCL